MIPWTNAIAIAIIPLLFTLAFQYIVSSPWYCSGTCCFLESSCVAVSTVGSYDTKYKPIVNDLRRSLSIGWDLGASMAVIVDGAVVVDVAGGYKDSGRTVPYDTYSMNLVFSSGKVMEAMAVAILEDWGLLNIDHPVSKYWPEYGQSNKGAITIRDILTHRSGSSYSFDAVPSLDVLTSIEKRDAFVASQTYLYPRGTVSYRMFASAFITDAICRRVDPKKRTLAQFVVEEVFDQLPVEANGNDNENDSGNVNENDNGDRDNNRVKKEVFISPPILGRGEEYESNFSEVHDVKPLTMLFGIMPQLFLPNIYSKVLPDGHYLKLDESQSAFLRTAALKRKHDDNENGHGFSFFDQPGLPDTADGTAACWNNHSSYLSYEMMSANSISNARALAKAFDAFMSGKIVRDKTLKKMLEPMPYAYDRLLMTNLTYATGGWMTNTPNYLFPINEDCSGWFGYGGSMLVHCTKVGGGVHNVTFSYVMNVLSPTFSVVRGMALLQKLTALLSAED